MFNLKIILRKYGLIIFFFLGLTITIVHYLILIYNPFWRFLSHPFVMLPLYLTNVIKNINSFNFLDGSLYWSFDPTMPLLFFILGGICYLIIFNSLLNRNKNLRKTIIYFLFIFYSLSIITRSIKVFLIQFNKISGKIITVGSGNLVIVLSTFIVIMISLFLLIKINKDNRKLIIVHLINFCYLLFEIFLALFIAIIFIPTKLDEAANLTDLISGKSFHILNGFLLFLLARLSRKWLLSKIN